MTFDREILAAKLAHLRAAIREAGGVDGLATFIEALRSKHEVFAGIAAKGDALDGADLRTLGGLVFSVRRRLAPVLAEREGALTRGVRELLASGLSADDRLHALAALAGEDRKLRRGLWDFGAEILHFSAPEQVPPGSRWVWDTGTATGALREFIRGNDTLRQVPIGDGLAAIEGARQWFYAALSDEGFYRDLPFVTDLVWAQAYSDYARSLSMHLGLIDAQFGARQDPLELVVKILGIDAPGGRLKAVRDEPLH
ncbi:hypothetical protein TVNIR_3246 [Thioalkalivibrio nitratireducens DSM 14787]|uniref:Uncharacterized protein n=1 Tax=Thioalkalivibrio nitratireducens (strain DSM 14787 / UNIQEM 213 / ALEN2) TaxID=1255043 RepID=L0E0T2_THIND|nr:hypothetical protein TVNIR_3246 [Thioalkalivibrio nitratireducens DSM 14787]